MTAAFCIFTAETVAAVEALGTVEFLQISPISFWSHASGLSVRRDYRTTYISKGDDVIWTLPKPFEVNAITVRQESILVHVVRNRSSGQNHAFLALLTKEQGAWTIEWPILEGDGEALGGKWIAAIRDLNKAGGAALLKIAEFTDWKNRQRQVNYYWQWWDLSNQRPLDKPIIESVEELEKRREVVIEESE